MPKSACASRTRTFWPPCSSPILRLVQMGADVEAIEQNGGVGFGGVAALVADDAFEFAEAHAVFIGELVGILGVKNVALLQRFPKGTIAHDHGVDHAAGVEGELILAQNAEFLRTGDGAFGGFDFAGEDLHERGLAGAVGAGDGVAAPREKRRGDVFEQDAGAVAHGDIIDG